METIEINQHSTSLRNYEQPRPSSSKRPKSNLIHVYLQSRSREKEEKGVNRGGSARFRPINKKKIKPYLSILSCQGRCNREKKKRRDRE
ncbi:hypothetical protein Scep_027886 [Stephania cephalantha]|uniref:Uncharacterized protein n=1 Tax=Stephania cephalantha TaxID=152367 RepID=A0AAP0E8V1_9MAGN